VFSWLGAFYSSSIIGVHSGSPLINFAVYSLPDGLWLVSCMIIVGIIWESRPCQFYTYSIPVIISSIAMEFLQITHAIPGTYDFVDVITLCMSGGIGVLIYHIYIKET